MSCYIINNKINNFSRKFSFVVIIVNDSFYIYVLSVFTFLKSCLLCLRLLYLRELFALFMFLIACSVYVYTLYLFYIVWYFIYCICLYFTLVSYLFRLYLLRLALSISAICTLSIPSAFIGP